MRRAEIENLLPGVFRRTVRPGNPLFGLLAAMEGLHAPSEAALANLDATFDPRRTPDAFLPFLARWVDLDRLFEQRPDSPTHLPLSSGPGRLRELIATAAYLSQWRGTTKGFLLFLETATGVSGFEIEEQAADESGQIRPFHLRVRAPAAAAPHRPLIEKVIELEKPAYATCELAFKPK